MYKKIIFLGSIYSGKTSIINILNNNNNNIQSTIGVEYTLYKKKFHIWDTAGDERYLSIIPLYYRNADIIIIVIDSTIVNFFENILFWLKEIKKNTSSGYNIYLFINKIDKCAMMLLYNLEIQPFLNNLIKTKQICNAFMTSIYDPKTIFQAFSTIENNITIIQDKSTYLSTDINIMKSTSDNNNTCTYC